MPMRFNHMELTLPRGTLKLEQENIIAFYNEVFGFEAIAVPMVDQRIDDRKLMLRTDPESSQFLFLVEQDADRCLHAPGYDHLGFLYEDRQEVTSLLRLCQQWQAKDPRLQIKTYDDLDTPQAINHTVYIRYLLPIWFDIHTIEFKPDFEPQRRWHFD